MPYEVSVEEFEEMVRAALDTIPATLRERMDEDNLMFVVEPGEDPLEPNPRVLGYYQGSGDGPGLSAYKDYVSPFRSYTLPKRIVILQRHIEHFSRTRDELAAQVQDTVLHEVAHYFGMSHADIAQTGLRH